MKLILSLLLLLIASFYWRCEVPTAHESPSKRMVIVSDYLHAKDTVLFDDFVNATDIKVKIIYKTADEILGALRNKQFNSGYDLILLNSLYDVNRFSKNNLFHSIKELPKLSIENHYHSSERYNYVGFALDPYTISYNPDTTFKHRTYSDLKNHDFVSSLDDRMMIPMLASLMSKLNKVKVYKWLKEFDEHRDYKLASVSTKNAYLTVHSNLISEKLKDTNLQLLSQEHFPNIEGDGVFYNLKTFCFVAHAENIRQAETFVNFYMISKNNGKLSKKLNMYPAIEIHNNIRFFKIKSEKLMQYYGMTERILNRIRK